MASARFLEEALTTEVDESAVNAIVGSLETQLVTATPTVSSQQSAPTTVNQNHVNNAIANGGSVSSQKHGGVANGGNDSMNIILNSETNKSITTSTLQSGNVVTSNVVNTVVASLPGAVPASGYINQVTSSATQQNLPNLTKPHEAVKIVYPSASQSLNASGGVNINSRVTFPNQTVGGLPNGNLGLSTPIQQQTVLNAVTSSVQSVVSQSPQVGTNVAKQIGSGCVIGVEQGKATGTTLVIKTTNPSVTTGTSIAAGVVSVPMTVNTTTMTLSGTHVNTAVGAGTTATSGVSGVVTLAKPITQTVGTSQTVVGNPSGTLLPAGVQIVNAIRPGATGPQGQKTLPPRVILSAPHMLGTRFGSPGQITLSTLQGLQPGTQGHLLLKTENGQYQLLRVGPAAPSSTVTPNSSATTIPSSATYRLQSVPAQQQQQQQHSSVTVAATTAAAVQPNQTVTTVTTQNANAQRPHTVDSTKEKCRKFLANLLELSSREPISVERNVRTLIQELIDARVEPEEFCNRLERLLNASPQPCLIGFLKKSLPLLRQSLVTKELVIDGIRPPPHTVVFSLPASATTVVPQLQQTTQIRPQPVTAQVRVMTPGNATQGIVTTIPRPGHAIQQRLVAPVRTQLPAGKVVSTLQPQLSSTTTITSTTASTTGTLTTIRPTAPAVLPKPTAKDKEKKSYTHTSSSSSTAYTGDDDINDVAAMGGVNLAEETQRILGSTEFVGTQIRSCKDEIFLHASPLQHKIKKMVQRHGLDEPSSDVAALISHACQERLKNLVEKLAVISEHRLDVIKMDPRYEATQDVKGQLKFLEELDRLERKRHEEQEREMLLRAAKSRSKSEDPEQAKLKAKAKEMQRAEMEELRQREANLTALQAIGPRKKPKLDMGSNSGSGGQSGVGSSSGANSLNRTQLPMRPRVKRVNLRDLLYLLEQEKETCRTPLLYKSYLK